MSPGRTTSRCQYAGSSRCELLEEARPDRPRPDEAHVAAEDVPELRDLVELGRAQPAAERRRLVLRAADELVAEIRAEPLLRAAAQRPELEHREDASATADALAPVEERAAARHEQRRRDRDRQRERDEQEERQRARCRARGARRRARAAASRPRASGEAADERVIGEGFGPAAIAGSYGLTRPDLAHRKTSSPTLEGDARASLPKRYRDRIDSSVPDPCRKCHGGIMFAYGYAPARRVLRRRRAASFSQAAERLGVTQPAVSLQIRSLEQRLGRQLLDRSGRRVEPTEAGLRLYRERAAAARARGAAARGRRRRRRGRADRDARARRVDRPGRRSRAASLLCEFQRAASRRCASRSPSPTRNASSSRSPTASSSSASSARRAGTAASCSSRSSATRSCSPARRPPLRGHARSSLDELREEPLIVMQEGAGVRQVIEDELRAAGHAPARPRRAARARPAGVGHAAPCAARLRRHVHLALGDRGRPRRRARSRSRASRGSSRARDLARRGRPAAPRRAPRRRSSSSRASGSRVIVRWGLDELPGVLGELGSSSGRCSSRASAGRRDLAGRPSRAGRRFRRPGSRRPRAAQATACSRSAAAARSTSARPSRRETGLPLVSVPTTYAGAEWTRFFGVRDAERRMRGGGGGARLGGDRLRAAADARPAARRDRAARR